jgi:protein SCO1/2
MSPRRILLWGLLVFALVAVAGAGIWEIVNRPEPPPVLGEVPDFALTNRDGRTIQRSDLIGEPYVVDFIFTRCAASCPMMTLRMARLNRDLPPDLTVRLVSFTVDPDYDTPAVLERYAQSFKAPQRWLFLTGPRAEIYRLIQEGFKLAVDAGGPQDEPILHSTRFVLVDGEGDIRGYYEAFDEPSMKKLRRDLDSLRR